MQYHAFLNRRSVYYVVIMQTFTYINIRGHYSFFVLFDIATGDFPLLLNPLLNPYFSLVAGELDREDGLL